MLVAMVSIYNVSVVPIICIQHLIVAMRYQLQGPWALQSIVKHWACHSNHVCATSEVIHSVFACGDTQDSPADRHVIRVCSLRR